MTQAQIVLVQKTWKMLRGVDPLLIGDTFYSKLFADHPFLQKMFRSDKKEQYRKLVDMLTVIVTRLEHLDELSQDIRAMALRHEQYGVKPVHYKWVGSALLWTLEQALGNDWTPAVREAWTSCYHTLSATMIGCASPA